MVPDPSFVDAFKENPLFFVLALFLAGLGLAFGVLALLLRGKPGVSLLLALGAVSLGFASAGAGALGAWVCVSQGYDAVAAPGLSANDRARLLEYSHATAVYPLATGVVGGALPMLLGGVAIIFRRRRTTGS